MSRRKLKRFELSEDYYVTVERNPDPSYADRIFTFSGLEDCPQAQRISLHAEEIEILIPVLQQARQDMLREENGKADAADNSNWVPEPEVN